MFVGLLGLQCNGNGMESGRSILQHYEVMEGGGKASESAGESCRKRPHRRPGYMRADLPRPQSTTSGDEDEEEEEEAEGRNAQPRNGGPGAPVRKSQSSIIDLPNTPCKSPVLTPQESLWNLGRQPEVESHTSWLAPSSPLSLPKPPEPVWRSAGKGAVHHQAETGQSGTPGPSPTRHGSAETRQTPGDSFNSSFSFIQQSLSANQGKDITGAPLPVPRPHRYVPLQQSTSNQVPSTLTTTQAKTEMLPASGQPLPKLLIPVPAPGVQEVCWQGGQWGGQVELPPDLPDGDSFSLGTEFPSSLSVDSDTASSVTSGYESATPASDQSWDHLVRKYEGVLQECLQNNHANTKIESMMLKLQRLQQKAILDDDYDTAERFGKKLEELCRERSALKLGLPSRQPGVASFLQRLTQAVNSALQRTLHCQRRESFEPDAGERSSSQLLNPRDLLVQEKHLVEEEMVELQRRLAVLQEHRGRLEEQLQEREEEQSAADGAELEGSVLRGYSATQLGDMSRALHDLVTSECRTHIAVTPSPAVLRLQEQEKALNLSIKEATAKVVTSQRLGGSLRRKVSETETQLLALHEAKLAAISGNDFGSAKELKAEMKAVYQERDRLERLARRLQRLSWGNGQDLARMKEQQQQLRVELEQREAQHESLLKENAAKYIELLEDRLPSCGCPPLEKVWEADLEACQLFLRGHRLRTPSYSGPDSEEPPSGTAGSLFAQMPTTTKEEEEEDCAMLTALGGRWCPEANLQHSEFTKKLEEFLFCMEDSPTEEECGGGAGAGELTEQCDMISHRLTTLEDDMQMAILSRDHALTQSLAKEVQEVKATLQAMLALLKEEEEEEEEEERCRTAKHDCDLMENGIEDEEEEEKDDEEEEDQYFSDSWDI